MLVGQFVGVFLAMGGRNILKCVKTVTTCSCVKGTCVCVCVQVGNVGNILKGFKWKRKDELASTNHKITK